VKSTIGLFIKVYDISSMRNKYHKPKETPGGGACLFNAVAFGLLYYKGQNTTNKDIIKLGKKLRKTVVQQMAELIRYNSAFKAIIIGEMESYNNLTNSEKTDIYISRMKRSSTWGGEPEAKILNSIVKTLGLKGIVIIDEDTNRKMPYFAGNMSHRRGDAIHITLNDVTEGGCHFSFVIPRSSMSV
jgi:hypothetical protein